jgi:transglutaminase-like putative cysteine protease
MEMSESMLLRLGCVLTFHLPARTPMIVMLNVHYSLVGYLEQPDRLSTDPPVMIENYRDPFGNWCCRLVAPQGRFQLRTDGVIRDDGTPDPYDSSAIQRAIEDLPPEAISFLLPSRYCESDRLLDEAWRLFGATPPGWGRVQAICDFVHDHMRFGYEYSRATRTAAEAFNEGVGVCRDFTHLAIAFCRAMNLPARYCTGYVSDVGQPPPHAPMDFAAWMEVYLGGRWWVFDPRNNDTRYGRILIARGRDAADVPLTYTFGPNTLTGFRVWIDKV